ncbi:MAG: methyltransferase domain-containing protein [Anaerolineae bacterium]|nr:methyltransferase domain-containing protein [Anaerolineae bacterium]
MVAFESKARDWQRYTETPLGRLRQDLTLYHLLERLVDRPKGSVILDAGTGTGGYAWPLAQAGHHVTLLDLSPTMLAIAREQARRNASELLGNLAYCCGSVESIPAIFAGARFDAILAHTLLEYLDDPWGTLQALLDLLVSGGILSILVTNPHADALRWALVKGDLERAREALHDDVSQADLFGLPRRTLDSDLLLDRLSEAGILNIVRYGVRIFADYCPISQLGDPDFMDALWRLEVQASSLPAYLGIARYHHLLGSKP